jgi:DNA-binding GntR family transcriptional regulator
VILSDTLTSIRSLQLLWIARLNAPEPDAHRTASEHVAVFEAIERGDGAAAREAMAADMAQSARELLARLKLVEDAASDDAAPTD